MRDALLLGGILAFTYAGFGLLALCQDCHRIAATGRKPVIRTTRSEPVLAALLISGSLILSLYRDGIILGLILWVTMLTTSALAVTFTLSWRPAWLGPLARVRQWSTARRNPHQTTINPRSRD